MTIEKAIELVLDLARQNVIDEKDAPEAHNEQTEAIATVEDFFTNVVFK